MSELRVGISGMCAAACWVGIAVTLVSFVAGFLPPLELLVHFHGCYAITLTLGAIVCLLARARRTGIATLVVAIIDAAFVVPLYFDAAGIDAATGRATLRVMTVNVETRNRDVQSVLDLIAAERPDVVAIQEIDRTWQLGLGALRASHPFHLEVPRHDNFGIGLYSRYPCSEMREIALIHAAVPSIRADVIAPNGRFAIVTTHPPLQIRQPSGRDRQLRAVAEHMSSIAGHKILLGDLNTSSWTSAFAALCDSGGLRDSRRGFGLHATWPSRLVPFAIAIDHVLVSPEFTVLDHRVGPAVGSDHRPLVVDLRLD